MTMTKAQIAIPPKLGRVFRQPRGELRYRCAYGGRGSGKSFSFALMAATWGYKEPLRVLCTRELQVSIKESFHAELKAAIASQFWLAAHYDVGIDYLRGKNGTEFIFRGLRHNMGSIKSMAKIDLCIVEEAEDVPEQSWVDLEPTIRAPKSEIWVIWNPRIDGSPVDKRFIKNTPPRSAVVKLNDADNPRFPMVLEEQRKHAQRTLDPGLYTHIWEGAYWSASDAQILNGKYRIDEFTPADSWDGPYYGADWGFAQDPTTLVKLWIAGDSLFVEHEAYQVGLEIDHTPSVFDQIPGIRQHIIRADSARPETISYMKRQGFKVVPAEKGTGSVEDGIAHLRSYKEIIIHPRCKHAIEEARLWSYKIDRLSGDILPKAADGNDHIWDAARYALEPIMKKRAKAYKPTRIPWL